MSDPSAEAVKAAKELFDRGCKEKATVNWYWSRWDVAEFATIIQSAIDASRAAQPQRWRTRPKSRWVYGSDYEIIGGAKSPAHAQTIVAAHNSSRAAGPDVKPREGYQRCKECGCEWSANAEEVGCPSCQDGTAKTISVLREQVEKMRSGLEKAVETIQIWHGEVAWPEYQHSPEMKQIRAALAIAPGRGAKMKFSLRARRSRCSRITGSA